MELNVNEIPYYALSSLKASQAILFCSEDTAGVVHVTTSLNQEDLHPIPNIEILNDIRVREGVSSLTLTLLRIDGPAIERAAFGFDERFQIIAELDALLKHHEEVYVVYLITHFNRKPCEELTVFIGGDCYRDDQNSVAAILERTHYLSSAMIRKGVMIFPDIPILHGGKKGEWIVVDRNGLKIEGLSESAIVALGTLIIPMGVVFLNQYKERRARERGILKALPSKYVIRPDTGSPDVLSGQHWKAMCNAWHKRSIDLSYFTCLPESLGGPGSESARPTGYGIATTAITLADAYFNDRSPGELQFLVEALGGVGINTIEALVQNFGVPAKNIVAFDPKTERCKYAKDKFDLADAFALSHEEFYSKMPSNQRFDVWINNGPGNNTAPDHIKRLLESGTRIFCGAANNLLRLSSREESLELIFSADAWVWPDEAASGGGWTLAVMDVYRRCQGLSADDGLVDRRILDTIVSRNETLVKDVLHGVGKIRPAGRDVWDRVNWLIDNRVAQTISCSFDPLELAQMADVRTWSL